jgi:hypothetical protein
MCYKCFHKEYYRFESQAENDAFELLLTQRLDNDSVVFEEDIEFMESHSDVYMCQSCNTRWWYSSSDHAWRGYLLPEEKAKVHIEEIVTKHRRLAWRGCIAVSILMIAIAALIMLIAINNS